MTAAHIIRDLAVCLVVAVGILFFASVLSWAIAGRLSRLD